jgi:pantothenate kinase
MKYYIQWTETRNRAVTIEALSEKDALKQLNDRIDMEAVSKDGKPLFSDIKITKE